MNDGYSSTFDIFVFLVIISVSVALSMSKVSDNQINDFLLLKWVIIYTETTDGHQ